MLRDATTNPEPRHGGHRIEIIKWIFRLIERRTSPRSLDIAAALIALRNPAATLDRHHAGIATHSPHRQTAQGANGTDGLLPGRWLSWVVLRELLTLTLSCATHSRSQAAGNAGKILCGLIGITDLSQTVLIDVIKILLRQLLLCPAGSQHGLNTLHLRRLSLRPKCASTQAGHSHRPRP